MKLQNKFLIPIISLIISGMVILTFVSYITAKQELEKAVEEGITQVADSLYRDIGAYIKSAENNILVWSTRSVYGNLLSDESSDKSEIILSTNTVLKDIAKNCTEYEFFAVADTAGTVLACSDSSQIGTLDIRDRTYFRESMQGQLSSSDILLSKVSGVPVFVVSAPIVVNNKVEGVFLGSLSLSNFIDAYVTPIKVGEGGYAYMLDRNANVIAHPDSSLIMTENFSDEEFGKTIMEAKDGYIRYSYNGVKKAAAFRTDSQKSWTAVITANDADVYSGVERIQIISIILTVVCVAAIGIIVFFIVRSIVIPIKKAVGFAGTVADGDLTVTPEDAYLKRKDEIGELAVSLNSMKDKLLMVVSDIKDATNNVASGSQQMSATAQQLSQGATEQAASAEEVSSSMEQMGSNIQQNADNAMQTEKISQQAAVDTDEGGRVVLETVDAMNEIATKIGIIEEIARNTNLLALNAAIEAARAGEHGKGFAVVAAEVRKLAERSQEAAKEISDLSARSVEIADSAGVKLQQIVPDIKKTAELVQEISASSMEQRTGMEQINQAIIQLDQVVQQNASASEEMAAMAEELSGQADQLRLSIGFFRVNDLSSNRPSEAEEINTSGKKTENFERPKKGRLLLKNTKAPEPVLAGYSANNYISAEQDNEFVEY